MLNYTFIKSSLFNHHQIRRNIHYDNTGSKTNQNRRLSAKFGVHNRQATRQQPLVQITAERGSRSLVQGKHRTQPMV